MVSLPQLLLRVFQFLCVLISLALVAAAIDDQFFGNSSVNWAMFVAVFSMIVVFYGVAAAFVEGLAQPMILGAMDGLATLFNFIAGVVLASKLGVHSCSNRRYLVSNSLTQGMAQRCRLLQAATAFFWFAFAFFAASIAMDFIGGGSSMARRSNVRKSAPTMSQV
ncbi:uncharacterized protein EAF01_011989 [Botrytis porri]|uniref:MARVEL domain-containing protein n=1 Tax=Botrytis porri TaxID=87229 RepID=A0A4Z1KTK5_9HELO|nr:uncharacterized protein EAF01_011989 [Botrytis porri]KAF7880720.1 hypothetical protein EAF01_011989 [Botrytis porri]TGO87719.1 hypothetical protein BPOR_0208g00070 [Botrytis porri]